MEESTEVLMETNVISTTEDVPETQEVMGSNRNVEMVIVVEKVDEEDMSSNIHKQQQPSPIIENTDMVSEIIEKSPQKDIQLESTPENSPIQDVVVIQSPHKPELSQEFVCEDLPQHENEPSDKIQEEQEAVSPMTEVEPIKSVDISDLESNQNKVQENPVEHSPKKDAPIPVQMSPTKELVLSDSTITKEISLTDTVMNGRVESCDNTSDLSCNTKSTVMPIDITIERDTFNDSQLEENSIDTVSTDTSEKEHNRSISRELKSLIKSAKESKIISECTQLTSKKRRKSISGKRSLDTSTTLNISVESDKVQRVRRNSDNSQKSNCSEKSEKVAVKRSMRSQNPEFVSKVKQFLNSVTGKHHKDSDDDDDDVDGKVKEKRVSKHKSDQNYSLTLTPPKIKKIDALSPEKPGKLRSDSHCWRCHWAIDQTNNERTHSPVYCTVCPRAYHYKCLTSTEKSKLTTGKSWVCPECMIMLQAESSDTRAHTMKKISLNMLCDLLKYALERMMDLNGVEPFMQPVDRAEFPDYDKYIVHPMDLSQMQLNIAEKLYGSTEAFFADAQWILHNSVIFNTLQSKLTAAARALVRSCRAEVGEIEACPECYAAAHARKPTWFTDVCTTPHILLWAKLKGFPYWPAKGMSVSSAGHVDVRFFGAHDRAWVPAKDCFLYSEKDPNNFRTKRQDIIDSMQEAEEHIRNISRKYGKFVYPPFKTLFDPSKLPEQLKMMIPAFEGEVTALMKEKTNTPTPGKKKTRTYSVKGAKNAVNDGDTSEIEETQDNEQSTPVSSRKMADGAEIAREDEDIPVKSDASSDVIVVKKDELSSLTKKIEQTSQVTKESSRKRRRSELEEAVITIMDNSLKSPEAKRKSIYKIDKEKKKSIEPTSSKKLGEKLEKALATQNTKHETTAKDNEASSTVNADSDKEKHQRVTPIRIAFIQKDKRHNLRTSTAKDGLAKIVTPNKDKDECTAPLKLKPKIEKFDKEKPTDRTPKDEKLRSTKRRNSRNNRSLSSTTNHSNNKTDNTRRFSAEKKSEKAADGSSSKDKNKENTKDDNEKPKENGSASKDSQLAKSKKEKLNSPKPVNPENNIVRNRLQFDDDTTLAVIARETKSIFISNNTSGLPTISSVISLSTTAQSTSTIATKTTANAKTAEVTIDISSDSSTCTKTNTDNVKNTKDDASKQKSKNDTESFVGRVGVRAFARMTSLEKSPQKNNDVQVEIKAEPIDVDDADRQIEKLNLMNAFRLKPVNPQVPSTNSLREVRLNKVVVTPLNAKKNVKAVEVKQRAKKSFPQSKKPEDGQLNSKNSMVYIPIQPPMTQAPVRPPRVVAGPTCPPATLAKPMPTCTVGANSQVNTVTTPVLPVSSMSSPPSTVNMSTQAAVPGLGQVPAAVHTVPLMTSVNGQWMFSLQPIMSVGALDTAPSPPILNGVSERGNNSSSILPAGNNTSMMHNVSSGSAGTPAATNQSASKTPADTNSPGEPPRLLQRPLLNPLDANTPIGNLPPPSSAGPLTAKLNQNAVKLTDFFRALLEDSIEKLDEPVAQVTSAKLQLEHAKWKHQLEINEIKHNHELTLSEMRALFEKEKLRAVVEARRSAQAELEAVVKATKAKQWCANCSQEAQFYCCWNTSYCDYTCQRSHWAQHHNVCTQQRQDGNSNGEPPKSPESRLQPQPDNLPVLQKSTPTPALTVGGKLAPTRVYTQDQHNANTQKNAIIVSMVEDQSGNQTMKCVGTYKPSTTAQNISPIVLNKQIMNNEENTNKKVVSSGGYLIVGGGSNSSSVVTPVRGHAIQYFT